MCIKNYFLLLKYEIYAIKKAYGGECIMHFPIYPFHRSRELFCPTQMRGIAFKKSVCMCSVAAMNFAA